MAQRLAHERRAISCGVPLPQEQLSDLDIRSALLRQLVTASLDHPATVIVQELVLNRGAGRIDVAVLNGHLDGYEIKSERDSLGRLPGQIKVFGVAFDTMTLVVHPRHLADARRMVPRWWGIARAERNGHDVTIRVARNGRRNARVDPIAVAKLLWREELLEVLEAVGRAGVRRRLSRSALAELLAASVKGGELAEIVRARLKARTGWRPAYDASRGELGGHEGDVVTCGKRHPLGQVPRS